MKKAINQWLFPDDMAIEQCMALAKDAGFDAIELCMGENKPKPAGQTAGTLDEQAGIGTYGNVELALDTSDEDIKAIAASARRIGIAVHSIATALNFHYPLTSADPQKRAKGLEVVGKELQTASLLDAEIVITIPGIVTDDVSYPQALQRAEAAIGQLIETAGQTGVCMGLENVWNKFLLSPVEFRDFIDKFDSEYVCALFDVGNILAYGYPEQWIDILGGRIKSVHVKDFRTSVGNMDGFVNLLQGDVNWTSVMNALHRVGYDGFLTVESIPAYKHCPGSQVYESYIALDRLLNL